MSRSDWGIYAAIGAVAVLLALGWASEPQQPLQHGSGAHPSTVSKSADTQQQARIICDGKCDLTFGGGALATPSANEDQPETQQSGQASSQVEVDDLWAQRRMAHWALFTALMAGAGVIGVLWTLKAARDANLGFALASQQQLSAYVVAEDFKIEIIHHDHGIKSGDWSFKLRNAGATPAFEVAHEWKVDWETAEGALGWAFGTPEGGSVLGPDRAQAYTGRLHKPGTDNPMMSAIDIALQAGLYQTFWIRGVVTYRDINKRKWRHEYCWEVVKPNESICLTMPCPARHVVFLAPHPRGNSLVLLEEASKKN